MMSLYDTFAKNSITNEVIWDLEEQHLKDLGVPLGDRLKYNKAKKGMKNSEGKILYILSFQSQYLIFKLDFTLVFLYLYLTHSIFV